MWFLLFNIDESGYYLLILFLIIRLFLILLKTCFLKIKENHIDI